MSSPKNQFNSQTIKGSELFSGSETRLIIQNLDFREAFLSIRIVSEFDSDLSYFFRSAFHQQIHCINIIIDIFSNDHI
jgi:hypothetical protein